MRSFRANVSAGEDVRIAYRDQFPIGLPDVIEDSWLFDEREIWVMHYDADTWRGASEDSINLSRYLDMREDFIRAFQPYSETKDDFVY